MMTALSFIQILMAAPVPLTADGDKVKVSRIKKNILTSVGKY